MEQLVTYHRRTKQEFGETKFVEEVVEEDTEDDEVLGIFTVKDSGKAGRTPIHVSVILDQKSCKMQLDTGATVSILPKALYDQQFNQWPLRSTKIKLKAYNGVRIPIHMFTHKIGSLNTKCKDEVASQLFVTMMVNDNAYVKFQLDFGATCDVMDYVTDALKSTCYPQSVITNNSKKKPPPTIKPTPEELVGKLLR
ncbi:hypothetical protein ACROYT_G025356 [Oculina patagonica]